MTPVERGGDRDRSRVRIPADVERPDRLLANLTARQLAILGVAGVVLWATYTATRHVVPAAVFLALACPIGATATLLAIGRVEGQPADRFIVAAWRQLRSPRRLVVAPEGVPAPPTWVAAGSGPLPAPLRLPLGGIDGDGTIDLGPDGRAVLCRASSVTFSLRTPVEQEALVTGFARWLNSLAEPAQLVVRAEPVELTVLIDGILNAAPGLAHPGLEAAARDHARFLGELAASRTLLRREVLVVLRQPAGDRAATDRAGGDPAVEHLRRRAVEATGALAAAGVALTVLGGPAATACISRALDPSSPPRPAGVAAADEVITGGVP
ncbi:MAG: PrgI family protein [Actinomycetota bacterium]|nr:PrgI family protein [Actinomycetota bacterium]